MQKLQSLMQYETIVNYEVDYVMQKQKSWRNDENSGAVFG